MDLDSLSSLLQCGPSHIHEQISPPHIALEVLDLCSSRTDKLLEAQECLTLMEKILYCVGFVESFGSGFFFNYFILIFNLRIVHINSAVLQNIQSMC